MLRVVTVAFSLQQRETTLESPVLVRSLWLLWVAFVVYGSLVPLEFHAMPWEQALAQFSRTPMLQLGPAKMLVRLPR